MLACCLKRTIAPLSSKMSAKGILVTKDFQELIKNQLLRFVANLHTKDVLLYFSMALELDVRLESQWSHK